MNESSLMTASDERDEKNWISSLILFLFICYSDASMSGQTKRDDKIEGRGRNNYRNGMREAAAVTRLYVAKQSRQQQQ
jgi:hypothetical protein